MVMSFSWLVFAFPLLPLSPCRRAFFVCPCYHISHHSIDSSRPAAPNKRQRFQEMRSPVADRLSVHAEDSVDSIMKRS